MSAAERLKAGDPDRFAAVMALPRADRPGVMALFALNLELARAPWASAEPLVAEIRLQWWVDAINAQAETGRMIDHEIGPETLKIAPQALAFVAEIAQARRRDCDLGPFADATELWPYLEATSGALAQAAGAQLGTASQALRDHGAASGLANWLVALPELTARGRLHPARPDAESLGTLAREGLARLEAAEIALRPDPRARLAALPHWQARAILRAAAKAPEKVIEGRLRGSEFSRRSGLLRARFAI